MKDSGRYLNFSPATINIYLVRKSAKEEQKPTNGSSLAEKLVTPKLIFPGDIGDIPLTTACERIKIVSSFA